MKNENDLQSLHSNSCSVQLRHQVWIIHLGISPAQVMFPLTYIFSVEHYCVWEKKFDKWTLGEKPLYSLCASNWCEEQVAAEGLLLWIPTSPTFGQNLLHLNTPQRWNLNCQWWRNTYLCAKGLFFFTCNFALQMGAVVYILFSKIKKNYIKSGHY